MSHENESTKRSGEGIRRLHGLRRLPEDGDMTLSLRTGPLACFLLPREGSTKDKVQGTKQEGSTKAGQLGLPTVALSFVLATSSFRGG